VIRVCLDEFLPILNSRRRLTIGTLGLRPVVKRRAAIFSTRFQVPGKCLNSWTMHTGKIIHQTAVQFIHQLPGVHQFHQGSITVICTRVVIHRILVTGKCLVSQAQSHVCLSCQQIGAGFDVLITGCLMK